MPYCYILHSATLNKFYIGATNDKIENRIQKHNEKFYGTHRFTAKSEDWKLFLFFETKTYDHAIRIERKIKSMKSSKYIMNIKKYPELKVKIQETTKKT